MSPLQARVRVGADNAKQHTFDGYQCDQCCLSQHIRPPWPNGQGVGLLIRRLRVRVPQGVIFVAIDMTNSNFNWISKSVWILYVVLSGCSVPEEFWETPVRVDGLHRQTLPSTDTIYAWQPHVIGNAERQASLCMFFIKYVQNFMRHMASLAQLVRA